MSWDGFPASSRATCTGPSPSRVAAHSAAGASGCQGAAPFCPDQPGHRGQRALAGNTGGYAVSRSSVKCATAPNTPAGSWSRASQCTRPSRWSDGLAAEHDDGPARLAQHLAGPLLLGVRLAQHDLAQRAAGGGQGSPP
ncbi:hypothetical protein SGLAM104S_05293 [Streptomyces glaucescens]